MAEAILDRWKFRLIGKLARVVTESGNLECKGILVVNVLPWGYDAFQIVDATGDSYHFGGDTNWLVEIYGEGVVRE